MHVHINLNLCFVLNLAILRIDFKKCALARRWQYAIPEAILELAFERYFKPRCQFKPQPAENT